MALDPPLRLVVGAVDIKCGQQIAARNCPTGETLAVDLVAEGIAHPGDHNHIAEMSKRGRLARDIGLGGEQPVLKYEHR